MKECTQAEVENYSGPDFTSMVFELDLARFGLESLDGDMLGMFKKRICDMAGIISAQINIFLN